MNTDRLVSIHQNILLATQNDIKELEELTHEFPYYSLPFVTLAKYYKYQDNYKYDSMLKKASLRVYDRSELFDYIMANIVKQEVVAPENIDSELVKVEPFAKLENEQEAESPKIAANETIEKKPIFEKEQEVESIDNVDDAPVKEESVIELEAATENKNEDIEAELEVQNEIIEQEPLETVKVEIETPQEVQVKITQTEESIEIPDINKIETPIEPPILGNDKPKTFGTFNDWLNKFNHSQVEEIKPKKLDFKKEPNEDIIYNPKESEKIVQLESKPIEQNPKKSLDLIDNFLRNSPSISKPKAEFFKPETAAKRSLEMSEDMITETLARIYAKQGHTEKAIWAYEKLSLKFPQKEAYFAALIEELNNTKER